LRGKWPRFNANNYRTAINKVSQHFNLLKLEMCNVVFSVYRCDARHTQRHGDFIVAVLYT